MKARFKRWPDKMPATAVVTVVALVGVSVLVFSHAATPAVSNEPEQGTLADSAVACSDPAASGGSMVKFGRNACQDNPIPAGDLIGWGSTSTGPSGYWHRLLKLKDGSWLRVFTDTSGDVNWKLNIYRSTDNARTWTAYSGVADSGHQMENGDLFYAPNGDLLLAGRSIALGSPNSSYEIVQYRSLDNGKTWTREADIDSAGAGTKGLWEPFYYSLGDGRMAVMWSDELYPGYSQVLVEKLSADNGKTWGNEIVTVSDGANGRPGMAGVTQMANGQFILVFELCGTDNCYIHQKISPHGWDWPAGVGTRVPGQDCGPFITSLSDGTLVLTSCRPGTDMNNLTLPVSYSTDFGASWHTNAPAMTATENYGFWVSLYQTGPNEIAYVSGNRIRFGTFVPRH